MKYIFVVGGVMSGVGKGIASASIGKILQSKGFSVTAIKIDPYVNVDAGTMNPTEHGEVFVLEDGKECDQDMGNYERFLNQDLTGANYMTTGSIYLDVITKERNLEYGGKNVEVVPQIPLAILDKIREAGKKEKAEIVITEVGGTVGEYQNILFLEAVRMQKIKTPHDVALVLVSLLPSIDAGGNELKTKPTQYAVRSLNAAGLQPDVILARAKIPLDEKRKEKIALNSSIHPADIISAPNVESIYDIPLNFERENLSGRLLKKLRLKARNQGLQEWAALVQKMKDAKKTVKIAMIGKYFGTGNFVLTDAYISVIEAVKHAAVANNVKVELVWLDAEQFEKKPASVKELSQYAGVIVPGGFGNRGVEGKILAIGHCRKNNIPLLGLCLGLQLSVIEFARNVAGIKDATSREFQKNPKNPVIDVMEEQKSLLEKQKYGGTMRLGAYDCLIKAGTHSHKAYQDWAGKQTGEYVITERHRHRYEVNDAYREQLEKKGLVIAGTNPQTNLVEIIEMPKHKFFVATQFHPEFKSRPLSPHPLFKAFIQAATK